ncbi:carbohydrate ABC transporter permease [Saccharopolyspora sp. K220]|uniref:carbohydrate ABC transporter permease n=1 Tax=Saccharopolyspora soli TaxID=2926618 RepID=UPI001F5AC073|nr:carbohydrate ABC transporter permease [Saccharopolyspora soli]MCI2417867.1 carbohydrate ABC transporter permease [Saccharopolyspora soli]
MSDIPRSSPVTRLLFHRWTAGRVVPALARHVVLVAVLVVVLYPLWWLVGSSFRPTEEIFAHIGPWPADATLDNYREGFTAAGSVHFARFFLNSFVIAVLAVLGNVLSCALAGYALARLEFRFRGLVMAAVIGSILLPYHVTIIPQYALFSELGWVGTILPLVLPKFLATDAFFVFLMVQFLRGLPAELDDAARIDGCGHWRIFTRIVVPLSLPAIGTTAMFTFVHAWNDFLGPLLYLTDTESYTVSQGLQMFVDATGQSEYGSLFAMAVLSLAPLVGFFLCAQRLLTEGIATTGLK